MIEIINDLFKGDYHNYKYGYNKHFQCRVAFIGYMLAKGYSVSEIAKIIVSNEDLVIYRKEAHQNLYNTDETYKSKFDLLITYPFSEGVKKPTYSGS